MSRVLVTGGAGFVGSHLLLALADRGDEAVVLDDLSLGHRAAVPAGMRLVRASLADRSTLDALLADGRWDGVFHFAARSQVGESMRDPLGYFRANVGDGLGLIEACVAHGVPRLVLSSTAALFGAPRRQPVAEDAPVAPVSAYGESKAMLERMLVWAERAHGLRHAALRYFNAAGADPAGRAGEHHDPETHLIPLAIDAALGRRPPLEVFGDDYPTPDGTCIRDYVHVSDLAEAHLLAFDAIGATSAAFNLGTGQGHSVREVLEAVGRVAGRPVPHRLAPRRAGDPAALVADGTRMRAATGWSPRLPGLDAMVRTAWDWRCAHPLGYDGREPHGDAP